MRRNPWSKVSHQKLGLRPTFNFLFYLFHPPLISLHLFFMGHSSVYNLIRVARLAMSKLLSKLSHFLKLNYWHLDILSTSFFVEGNSLYCVNYWHLDLLTTSFFAKGNPLYCGMFRDTSYWDVICMRCHLPHEMSFATPFPLPTMQFCFTATVNHLQTLQRFPRKGCSLCLLHAGIQTQCFYDDSVQASDLDDDGLLRWT